MCRKKNADRTAGRHFGYCDDQQFVNWLFQLVLCVSSDAGQRCTVWHLESISRTHDQLVWTEHLQTCR